MAESILEQISAFLATELAKVTVANGYHQTLTVSRNAMDFAESSTSRDLATFIGLDIGEDACKIVAQTGDNTTPKTCYSQRFAVVVHVLGQAGTAVAEETRINRVIADVHKQLGAGLTAIRTNSGKFCGGLADSLTMGPWVVGFNANWAYCTTVHLPIEVEFWVRTADPYQQ